MKRDLTQKELRSLLSYDPHSGVFTWACDAGRWGRIKAGTATGTPDRAGYPRINIGGTVYRCHRLAFLYMTGAWPSGEVDHMNHNRADNRWANLRDGDKSQNMENLAVAKKTNKSSGLLGAHWSAPTGDWAARITVKGTMRVIGRYSTAKAAHEAYLTEKRRVHAGCTI